MASRAAGNAVKIALAFSVSGFFVWLSLRGKDVGAIWNAVRGADARYLGAYCVVLVAIHLTRAARWGILLQPLGKVPFRVVNGTAAVGFLALMILPLRLGEFARPVLAYEHGGIRRSAGMATVVMERIVDGLCVAALLMLSLLAFKPGEGGHELELVRAGGYIVLAIFGGLLVALVFAYSMRERAVVMLERTLGRLSPRLGARAASILEAFLHGLRAFPSAGKIAAFFALTAFYWGLNGAGLKLVAPAFGFELSYRQAYLVLGMQVVGVMIPAAPGFIGTFQYFTELALRLCLPAGVVQVAGAAYAHTVWAVQFTQQILTGGLFIALGYGPGSLRALWLSAEDRAEQEAEVG
jgi:hypothetical protein